MAKKNTLLIELLRKTRRYMLLAQYELGQLTECQVLQKVINEVKDVSLREQLQAMLDKACPPKQPTKRKKAKKVPVNKLEMLEALKHGILNETYLNNKQLSLEEKLRLPDAWQVLFALNYTEKKHGKGKEKRIQ